MAKVCEICGHKEEAADQHEEENAYDILAVCESCLEDRTTKPTE